MLCIFLCIPCLTEDDLARLDTRSDGDAVEGIALSDEEDADDERRAPLSLFFALISASGVLMG